MSNILKGKAVADAILQDSYEILSKLKEKGIVPSLATVRLGEDAADISYETTIVKRCKDFGIEHKGIYLERNIKQRDLVMEIEKLNQDSAVHGVLMFRPFPEGIDEDFVRNTLTESKDIDGITDHSLVGVFTDKEIGFPPCTAQALMELLKYYKIECSGKRVAVIGRSLVVGKPLSMMLLRENATVRICHSRTDDLKACISDADIVVTCIGRAKMLGKEYLSSKHTVIDVGINLDKNNKLCGDVDFEQVADLVNAITPVPGGIGGITTAVLLRNVVKSAYKGLFYV